jgi:hypothetical protein
MRDALRSSVWSALSVTWAAIALPNSAIAGPLNSADSAIVKALTLTKLAHYHRPRYFYVYPRATYPNYPYANPSRANPSYTDSTYANPSYPYPTYGHPAYASPSPSYQNYDPTYWHRYPWRYGR